MSGPAETDRFVAEVVALYGSPGVKPACLELQDAAGVDVSVTLACAVLGLHGFALADDGLPQLHAAGLGELVRATDLVRRTRRRLAERDGWPSPLVRRTLDAEIAVEMVQIAFIWQERAQAFAGAPASLDLAQGNLRRAAGPAAPARPIEAIAGALAAFIGHTPPQDREHG